jgi:two-component system LytT family sensor kinase
VNPFKPMQIISESPVISKMENGVPTPASWFFRMLAESHRTMFFWCLQVTYWGGIGLVMFLIASIIRPSEPSASSFMMMRVVLGLLLSGGLREIYRLPVARQVRGSKKVLMVVGSCSALALIEWFINIQFTNLPSTDVASLFHGSKAVALRFIMLLVWSGFYVVFHQLESAHALELRALRAEVAARENQLRHLQAQINPHFLFNALNTVLASKDDAEAVREVTQGLADYLRFSLRETAPLEPLGREIDALETYLTVQRIRFREKLVFQIQCETAARAVKVPPMMIQPLLENAFHYGGKTSPLPLRVKLNAILEKNALIVTVANTGQWVPTENQLSTGIGIRSLRQRLQLLIGETSSITISADEEWVSVTIHIPLSAHSRDTLL